MSKKVTTEEFIERAKKVHGDRYDYSYTKYINSNTKIEVRCLNHGVFNPLPYNHLKGVNCPECMGQAVVTKEKFLKKAAKVHNNKYDYSLVDYKNVNTKVKIICPEHGVFEQRPSGHLEGKGCSKCSGCEKFTEEDFLREVAVKYSNQYDYSKIKYKNINTEIKIICPKHGAFFTTPKKHLNGRECSECMCDKKTKEFISKAKSIHGDRYDYSLVRYTGIDKKVKIICPVHGMFKQTPNKHLLRKAGCSKCALELHNVGYNEKKYFQPWIKTIFNNVDLQHQFDGLPYSVDAFIPELNLVVEYDEKQHFVKSNIEKDQQRQNIIEDMCGVTFYRIKDETFLEEKEMHEEQLKSMGVCL
jgi:very-short-patch-repair endonuclease